MHKNLHRQDTEVILKSAITILEESGAREKVLEEKGLEQGIKDD